MRPALSFSILLALGATLSLSIKARLNDYATVPDEQHLTREISAKLRRQHFITRLETHLFPESTVIATRGTCRVRITDGTRSNQLTSVLGAQSRSVGVVRYYYDGEWSSKAPLVRSELARYWQLVLGRLGIRYSRGVILVVAASPGCTQSTYDLSGMTIGLVG